MFSNFLEILGFGPTGYGKLFLEGMATTVQTASLAYLFALVLGVLLGAAACARWGIVRGFWRAYRSVFASIPTLLILFAIYFGAPYIASNSFDFELEIDPFTSGLLGLTLVYASYISEVVKGAVFAVPQGQYEACRALGLAFFPTWVRVIAPQAARISLPGLISTWIVLLKDSALVSVIGVSDVVRVGQIAGSSTGRPLFYLAIVGFFFAVVVLISLTTLSAVRSSTAKIAKGGA